MTRSGELRTARLLLRRWRPDDLVPFAALNADPAVMEHFPSSLTRAESDALVERIEAGFERHGFGLWAVEALPGAPGAGAVAPPSGPPPASAPPPRPTPAQVLDLPPGLLGFVGLSVTVGLPVGPAVEVGWRLGRRAWGRGVATEAAVAAIDDGRRRGVGEVVSFTAAVNLRSQRVMQRLGMVRDPAGDFDHPRLSQGSPLRRHVLYRLPAGAGPSAPAPAARARPAL